MPLHKHPFFLAKQLAEEKRKTYTPPKWFTENAKKICVNPYNKQEMTALELHTFFMKQLHLIPWGTVKHDENGNPIDIARDYPTEAVNLWTEESPNIGGVTLLIASISCHLAKPMFDTVIKRPDVDPNVFVDTPGSHNSAGFAAVEQYRFGQPKYLSALLDHPRYNVNMRDPDFTVMEWALMKAPSAVEVILKKRGHEFDFTGRPDLYFATSEKFSPYVERQWGYQIMALVLLMVRHDAAVKKYDDHLQAIVYAVLEWIWGDESLAKRKKETFEMIDRVHEMRQNSKKNLRKEKNFASSSQ